MIVNKRNLISTLLLGASLMLPSHSQCYNSQFALLRNISPSFLNSLKEHPPKEPIDLNKAEEQHQNYLNIVKRIVPTVSVLSGDSKYPDANFIEDTAVIVNSVAVISHMGAQSRRGEEEEVYHHLKTNQKNLNLTSIIKLTPPATLDGGDVMFTGKEVFVGQSGRTNAEGFTQLKEAFKGVVPVFSIPFAGALHLKSLISALDEKTIVIYDDKNGHDIAEKIKKASEVDYKFIPVPDMVAANVVNINGHLLIQAGFPKSATILKQYAQENRLKVIELQMSELIKADGALTCGSLLWK